MSKKNREKKRQVRTIEYHLKNYYNYKIGIENMQMKLDLLLPSMTTRYELDKNNSGAFVLYSTTEQSALDRIESRQALEANETIELYSMIVNTIDNAMQHLKSKEKEFIVLRYFERKTIPEICEKLDYSERQVHRLRYNVINDLLHRMSNIKDLKI